MFALSKRIFFVGPLPPPVHGFSWVNQKVLTYIQARRKVHIFDRALPRDARTKLNILRAISSVIQLMKFSIYLIWQRPVSVYLGWSGGAGMILDWWYVAVARLFRVPVYVHHHAFSYLNAPSRVASICMSILKGCQNIVLCSRMGLLLSSIHDIPNKNIFVLSNAAFLEEEAERILKNHIGLRVGFLSNITVSKGIFDFFDLADELAKNEGEIRLVIAGPVSSEIQDKFEARLDGMQNIEHIGPVYGSDKDNFYKNIDVLVFPTRYPNEAEPVTIIEAFRAGVPVIANQRGCIETLLDERSGLGVLDTERFVEQATEILARWLHKPEELNDFSNGARARFEELHTQHSVGLERILTSITKGALLGGLD